MPVDVSIIPTIKNDLVALMGSLEAMRLDYQRKGMTYKILTQPHSNLDGAIQKLDSPLMREVLPQFVIDIQAMPDYESRVKMDSNIMFSLLMSKALNKLIEQYQSEFHEIRGRELIAFIDSLIELEKDKDKKFNDQLLALNKLEEDKRKQELLVLLITLQAMKQRYAELELIKINLTVELKKNVSKLVDDTFVTSDKKPLPEKVRDSIVDRVVEFQKNKFFEIRNEIKKKQDQVTGKPYDPRKIGAEDRSDLNKKTMGSLKWEAANKKGVHDVVKGEFDQAKVSYEPDILLAQVEAFIKAEGTILENHLEEMAYLYDEVDHIEKNCEEVIETINEYEEMLGSNVDFDFLTSDDEPGPFIDRP